MSLSHQEWKQMWEAIRAIEDSVKTFNSMNMLKVRIIEKEINFIKDKIESVVGQME